VVQKLVSRNRVSTWRFNFNTNSETTYTEILSLISRFKQPYPKTHWCSIPVEDKTNKQLCRPLPVDRMPPPPRVEIPGNSLRDFWLQDISSIRILVPGSATWTQRRNGGNPTAEALARSWDEDISSDDDVQPQPRAGTSLITALSPSLEFIEHSIFRT
jgi:hypothetical protein